MNEDQDVAKSIELHVQSPAVGFFVGSLLALLFGVLIIAPFITTNGFPESGVAIALWYAGLAIAAAFFVLCGLLSPRRVFITTKGTIRFNSLVFKREYDLKLLTCVKVDKDLEGSRCFRLVFSDGQFYTLTAPYQNQYRKLATAILDVNPSVKIDSLPPYLFERIDRRA